MKILHVISTLSPRYGGPVFVCKDMCRFLAAAGDEVSIYTTDLDFPSGQMDVTLSSPVSCDGYSIRYFPVQFVPYVVSSQLAAALLKDIPKFDLVHIHGIYRFPQAVAAFAARRFKVPYVISPHGSLDPFLYNQKRHRRAKRFYEFLIERRNLNRSAALHFTAEEEMELVAPLKLESPGFILPNGLNLAKYENLPPPGLFRAKYGVGEKKIVLHFGRLNFKKGLDILVKAFAANARFRDDICLVLAGPDNEGYGKEVKKWVDSEGIASQVIFTGMLEGQSAFEVLRDADIFALPSYTENFGIAVIEAMACELPVVISNKVNIWREVKAADAGIVTNCDANEVAEVIAGLLDDEDRRRKLGHVAEAFVGKTYDWQLVVQGLRREYRRILSEWELNGHGVKTR